MSQNSSDSMGLPEEEAAQVAASPCKGMLDFFRYPLGAVIENMLSTLKWLYGYSYTLQNVVELSSGELNGEYQMLFRFADGNYVVFPYWRVSHDK